MSSERVEKPAVLGFVQITAKTVPLRETVCVVAPALARVMLPERGPAGVLAVMRV